jgi:ribosome-associated protein
MSTHLIITSRIQIPSGEFEVTLARSSGPGGQNVNKVNSKATLRWPVQTSPSLPEEMRERFLKKYARRITTTGDLLVTSQRYRDAGRNEADCLEKLRTMLLGVALPPRTRRPSRRTRGSVERRLQNKRRRAVTKHGRGRMKDEG